MKKLIANSDGFLTHFRHIHVQLIKKVAVRLNTEVSTLGSTLMGESGNHMLAELTFADFERFMSATKALRMTQPESSSPFSPRG